MFWNIETFICTFLRIRHSSNFNGWTVDTKRAQKINTLLKWLYFHCINNINSRLEDFNTPEHKQRVTRLTFSYSHWTTSHNHYWDHLTVSVLWSWEYNSDLWCRERLRNLWWVLPSFRNSILWKDLWLMLSD